VAENKVGAECAKTSPDQIPQGELITNKHNTAKKKPERRCRSEPGRLRSEKKVDVKMQVFEGKQIKIKSFRREVGCGGGGVHQERG